MAFHVRDPETDRLVRKLAQSRGIGITDAVREAASEALSRAGDTSEKRKADLQQRLQPLFERLSKLPRNEPVPNKSFYDDLWAEDGDRS